MTITELRNELHTLVDKLPEESLEEALDYIRELVARAKRAEFVKEIIKEDAEVLKRLAE